MFKIVNTVLEGEPQEGFGKGAGFSASCRTSVYGERFIHEKNSKTSLTTIGDMLCHADSSP